MSEFWNWFSVEIKGKLGARADTFEEIFKYLDSLDRPVCIVETGCIRKVGEFVSGDNWKGDGCSTILFDKYAQDRPGSKVFSVDIDVEATELCRKLVSDITSVYTEDSIRFLANFKFRPDLLYLDSYDLDPNRPLASSVHHVNELNAIIDRLKDDTLVVVDDSYIFVNGSGFPEIEGKGSLVAKHAIEVGASMLFSKYQTGWVGMNRKYLSIKEDIEELVLRARKCHSDDKAINASNIYRLILKLAGKLKSGVERVAYGEACLFFARAATVKERLGVAYDWYQQALWADPRAVDYRLEFATNVLTPMRNMDLARREAKIATKLEPDNSQTWRVLGGLEYDFHNEKEVLYSYDKGLSLASDDLDAILDLVSVLLDVPDYERARKLALRTFGTEREGEGHYILGFIAYREGRHEEAIESYNKAIELGVKMTPTLHWSKSLALHSIGRYKEGWGEHEWRAQEKTQPSLRVPVTRFNVSLWKGEPPPACIHIHAEAGAGDNLCCIRYLKLLIDKGYDVRFESYPDMLALIARSFPEVEVVQQAPDYPGSIGIKPFDYHQPIGGLPYQFGTDIDTVPWFGPYLKAEPDLTENYKQALPKGKKIGLCWSSGIREGIWLKKYGQRKSMHFNTLEPLFKVRNGSEFPEFISLQVGPERDQNPGSALDVLPEKPDWDDTAALVENLDLVITVDTAVAHLAGAMGKPVWVLCQRDGQSWHWMCYREGASWNEKSPWYPSARVFRQHRFNEPHFWDEVIEDVAKELEQWLK